MRIARIYATLFAALIAGACSTSSGETLTEFSGPFSAPDLPKIAGQRATCAGPREKTFTLEAREVTVDLGMQTRFVAWTYNGVFPGPALEACEGDHVTIEMTNHGDVFHGLDSHAMSTDMMHFGPVAPGGSLRIEKTVDTPGVFMYHCAAGPVTDYHIKSGLYGAMIVYPRTDALAPARELVIVESAIFGEADAEGLIPGTDPTRAAKNDPSLMLFNGRLAHSTLAVEPGDRVRAYVVNVGPGTAAMHVMGTLLDTVYDGTSRLEHVQTYGVAAGSGAMIEFRIPERGMYGLVDHDRLSYLPYGMVVSFDASREHVSE